MPTPYYLDKISDELFDKHSLAALIICINAGDELDFHYNDVSYGITWTKENKKLQLSSRKIEEVQEFQDCTDLVINGTIDNKKFMDIWDDIVLDFL